MKKKQGFRFMKITVLFVLFAAVLTSCEISTNNGLSSKIDSIGNLLNLKLISSCDTVYIYQTDTVHVYKTDTIYKYNIKDNLFLKFDENFDTMSVKMNDSVMFKIWIDGEEVIRLWN